ncbi:MAG: copper resistance CopC family protein [Thermodesulfovibrionales bacterium]
MSVIYTTLQQSVQRARQTLDFRTFGPLVLLAVLCISSEMSWAHSFPDHSDPKVGSTVASSPGRVRIWFDGALEPAFTTISVLDSGAKKVDKGDGRVNPADATLLEVNLPPLPSGTYRVIWNVVARDGHRTSGDYTFVIK